MRLTGGCAAAIAAMAAVSPAIAQTTQSGTIMALDWAERHAPNMSLKAHDFSVLGDAIDLQSGRLTFDHVDVSLPGNSRLGVEIRRRLNPSQMQSGEFADWQLAIPTISTKILADEWYAGNRWGKNRCSGNLQDAIPDASWPTHFNNGAPIPPSKYSDGVILDVPGHFTGEILNKTVTAGWPSSADKVTTAGWYLECITNIDGAGTEGFIAVAPNGDRYRFDKILDPGTRRSEFDIWQIVINYEYGIPGIAWEEKGVHYDILGVSEVTDVHGNWVRYTYDANQRLASIEANDGRKIAVGRTYRLIESVTTHPGTTLARTWTYTYGSKSVSSYKPPSTTNGLPGIRWETWSTLSAVTLPDGRQWQFDLANLQVRPVPGTSYTGAVCKQQLKNVNLTHPDGLKGTFIIEEVSLRLGAGATSASGNYCPNTALGSTGSSQISEVMAVTSRTLSSPSTDESVWQYNYVDLNGETRTTVIQPDGSKKVVFHPTPYDWATPRPNARIRRVEMYPTASSAVPSEIKDYTYVQEGNAGSTIIANGVLDTYQPVHPYEVTITRGTDWYKTSNTYVTNRSASNYSYGHPTQVREWSSLGSGTRIANFTYLKDSDDWILGLPATVTRNGKLFDDYMYDTKGRMIRHNKFGVKVATLSYHTTGVNAGNVFFYDDALARRTKFQSYKRGIPRTVTFPDSSALTRVVNDDGWITKETNPKGVATSWEYNVVGRLTRINRPGTWQDTYITYSYDSGVTTQQASTGPSRTTTNYDALLRPTRVHKQALSGGGGNIYTDIAYDEMGRTRFESLPSTWAGALQGVESTYDELGRLTASIETAAGGGTTTHEYLSANRTRVTDPEGHATVTTRRGFATPDDGDIIKVERPAGIAVDYVHDIYGNVLEMAQAKTTGGAHISNFYYDGRHRLCRRQVPETGDFVYAYNNADEMIAYAGGVASSTSCAYPPVATRVSLSYDLRGRLKTTAYGDGAPSISRTYDLNGNVVAVNRGGVNWTYNYNDLDLIASENLSLDSRVYSIGYTYDIYQRITQKISPSGNTYTYSYDGLGRPIQLKRGSTTYLNGIEYHPNGKIETLTRGNGGTYLQQLNARQLVSSIGGNWGETLNYTYDLNGRVSQINSANNNYDRSFDYDGAGRLAFAAGPWGSGNYSYDSLSNITQKKLGSRTVDIQYNAQNRLYRAKDSAQGNVWRNYSYDSRGNVSNDGVHGFAYDFENQTISISGSDTGTYTYDGNLKRVKQVVGGETIYTVYDSTGALVSRHNLSANQKTDYLAIAGQTFVRVKNGTANYPLNDHLGTALKVANANGVVSASSTYNYTPFGEAYGAYSPGDEQGYTGHVEDSTGLTYMQARYYNPAIGRFLQPDPIGYEDQLNVYAYVRSDPVNNSDPTGQETVVGSRPVKGSLGAGSHTFTQVKTDSVTTISSTNIDGKNVVSLNNPADAGDDVKVTDWVTIPPPAGMSEAEFDQAVLDQAAEMMKAEPTAYEIFPDDTSEGNCHTTTTNLIEGAGGRIPSDFDPKGLNPGLNEQLDDKKN